MIYLNNISSDVAKRTENMFRAIIDVTENK